MRLALDGNRTAVQSAGYLARTLLFVAIHLKCIENWLVPLYRCEYF